MKKRRNIILFIFSLLAVLSMMLLLFLDRVYFLDDFSITVERLFSDRAYFNFFYGITNIMSVLGIGLLFILLLYLLKKRGHIYALKNFVFTLFCGTLSISLLKILIGRSRPLEKVLNVDGYSFPSGHAYTSTIVYGFFILVIHRYYNNSKYRYLLYLLFLFMILLTCISRVYFKVHFVSDVLTGFFLGVLTLTISNHFLKRMSWLTRIFCDP